MCLLDVIFNFFLIFPTRTVEIGGVEVSVYGAGLGVTGAALGTALAEAVTAVFMLYITVIMTAPSSTDSLAKSLACSFLPAPMLCW